MPWDLQHYSAEPAPVTPSEIQESAIELSEFLNDTPINLINVDHVIPSAKLGFMYTVTIGRIISKDENGLITANLYTTNSMAVRMLETEIKAMGKKKRKQLKQISQNIDFINEVVRDPSNWKEPFNVREDN